VIAETYAKDPHYYTSTFCCECKGHYRVGQDGDFNWFEKGKDTGIKVGT
jgi:hypothetical protein